jgi:hypothetical protein
VAKPRRRQWDGWTLGQPDGLNRQLAVRAVVGAVATALTVITLMVAVLNPRQGWPLPAVSEALITSWVVLVLSSLGRRPGTDDRPSGRFAVRRRDGG